MPDPLTTKTRILLFSAVIFAAGIGAATTFGWTSLTAMPSFMEQPQVDPEVVQPAIDLSSAFINISEAVTPAVVRIAADRPQRMAQGGMDLRDFFPGFPGMPESPREPEERIQTAGGSGFIVSEDGYILTNAHVVHEAREIRVFLSDRREYIAEVVGSDPTTDVAVIRIEGSNFPTLSLGNSSGVRVGEWVLAVGSPGFSGGGGSSLENTVTAGIVSALGRPLQLLQEELARQGWDQDAGFAIENFIQTDAVINPGNSGGPLVNMQGQVVGINAAIASPTGYFQGYGFAIPMDLARRSMEDLIEYGQIRRPYLGIQMNDVDADEAEYYGLPRTAGALIVEVPDDGPARDAGIRADDIIVGVDDQDVESSSHLQALIAQRRPGDQVRIRLYRDRAPQEVTVRLGERELGPQPERQAAAEPSVDERIGIELVELTDEIARELGYSEAGGVVVRRVAPNSPADRRNVSPGLRIIEIDGEAITGLDGAEAHLSELEPGDLVALRVEDPNGNRRNIVIRIPG
jgi:serine protease Do